MRFYNLLFATSALALTACSSTDITDENLSSGAVIGFNSHVSNVSRAVTNDNLTNFYVYGGYAPDGSSDYHTSFNGVQVSKSGDDWTYTGAKKYWVEGATHKFYAYSCEHIALSKGTPSYSTVDPDQGVFKITDFVCNQDHQHDLVFAESGAIVGKKTGNSTVSFSFKHVLSKVQAKFKSGFGPEMKIQVSNVEIRNVYDKANFSSALAEDSRWTGHTRSIEYDESGSQWTKIGLEITGDNTIQAANTTEGSTTEAKEVTTQTGYFLPLAYSTNDVVLYFTIKVMAEDGTTITTDNVKANFKPTWKIGTSYTYNITVNGSAAGVEEIKFTVDATNGVQEWTSGVDADINVGS